MQIVYNGPHPEVVVDEFDPNQEIVAGQPVEIPDDLAARLLEQNTWSKATAKQAKAAAQDTPAPDNATKGNS